MSTIQLNAQVVLYLRRHRGKILYSLENFLKLENFVVFYKIYTLSSQFLFLKNNYAGDAYTGLALRQEEAPIFFEEY